MLSNAVRPLLVVASAYAGVLVAAGATLPFAGVGLQRPTRSWASSSTRHRTGCARQPRLLLLPGLALVAAVVGCVPLGEVLRRRTSRAGT